MDIKNGNIREKRKMRSFGRVKKDFKKDKGKVKRKKYIKENWRKVNEIIEEEESKGSNGEPQPL